MLQAVISFNYSFISLGDEEAQENGGVVIINVKNESVNLERLVKKYLKEEELFWNDKLLSLSIDNVKFNSLELETMMLKDLKKGEYFKTVNSKGDASTTIYIKGGYDRSEKKYEAEKAEDFCSYRLFKGTQKITTDFIY